MSVREASAQGLACARAALAGNPSDGYGGAVLAVTVPPLRAEATVRLLEGHAGTGHAATASCAIDPPSELVEATVRRFVRTFAPGAVAAAVRWRTSVPRGVGLGGSSAIVISTLRALCELHGVALPPEELASFALEVETEELGIAAGLQDRVAQAHGGLTFMEFGGEGRYEPLPPGLLAPLLVAWRPDANQESDDVHRSLRTRFDRGEQRVSEAMAELAKLARTAREALLAGDHEQLATAVDGSFEARQRVLELDGRHVEMVERARAVGASANYTGSGGAIVAVCRDEEHREAVAGALAQIGCQRLAVAIEGD